MQKLSAQNEMHKTGYLVFLHDGPDYGVQGEEYEKNSQSCQVIHFLRLKKLCLSF
jgi:hypothetical protein